MQSMKKNYSPVVDEVILERQDSSFSSSFSTTFLATFSTTYLNPFTRTSATTADPNGDNSDSKGYALASHPQWPKEPLLLASSQGESTVLMLYDAILFLLPVLLTVKLAIVIVAWHTDRIHSRDQIDKVSSLTLTLIQVNEQMVTIFTIIFAAIMSTVLQRYALYQAQQGASIGTLEQLHGSTSLVATLRMIWSLHSFGRTSVALLVVWSLYYFGSQASGLEYRRVDSSRFRSMVAAIPTPAVPSAFAWPWSDMPSFGPIGTTLDEWNLEVSSLCNAGFWYYRMDTAPGTDIAQHVLVPDLKFLTSPQLAASNLGSVLDDQHGWYDVSKQSWVFDRIGYSSFTGWPATVYDGTENMTLPYKIDVRPLYLGDFTFSPYYFSADCSVFTLDNNTTASQTSGISMTPVDPRAPRDVHGNPQRSFEVRVRLVESQMSIFKCHCNISQINVVLQTHCQTTGCFPRAMRWANNNSAELSTSFGTIFDDPIFAATFFAYLFAEFHYSTVYLLLSYINNGTWDNQVTKAYGSLPTDLKIQLLTSRAATIGINSFYQASLRMHHSQYTFDQLIHHSAEFNMTTVPFRGARYNPHYAISWGWITVDLVCCLVLLTAAVTSIVLRMRTMVPDILGSVSSLTRANPDSNFPDNGTSLSGIERARMMKKVTVRLGDLSTAEDEVGRIGLARIDFGNCQVGALSKTIKYT